MNTFALKITKEIKQKVDTFFSSDKKIDKKDLDVYSNFHLPISYLNDNAKKCFEWKDSSKNKKIFVRFCQHNLK